jgi:phosphate transport system permease protein
MTSTATTTTMTTVTTTTTGEPPAAGGAATELPRQRDEAAPPLPRRQLGGLSRNDRLSIVGAAASAVCVALLLFGPLTPLVGRLGFVALAYGVFLATYALLVWLEDDGPAVVDKVMTVVLGSAAVVMMCCLASVVTFTMWRGRAALSELNLYTQDMSRAGPADPLTVGGIKHAVYGTLCMIALALVLTVPLGIACAAYLNETRNRASRFVRTVVEAMTALPSVLAGLFIFATWILILGFGRSGLAAALAISIMMLPIIIRASDVVLRLVPGNLREASAALGAPAWRTVWHVVLPTARSGLATSVILGTARGIGETSPVLLTAGFTSAFATNPFQGSMVSLPLAAFEFVRSPQPALIARGFATAAVLMALVLLLFAIARVLGGRGPGHVSSAQARRIARRSEADAARFASVGTARGASTGGAG